MKNQLFLMSLLAVCGMIACTPEVDPDTQKPTIDLHKPDNWQSFAAGTNELEVDMRLEDDNLLGQMSLNIHENFQEHEHSRLSFGELKKYAHNEIKELEAPGENLTIGLMIPEDAMAGPYHLSVQVTDAEGNSTSFEDGSSVIRTILITNDSQAKVQLEGNPEELDVSAGEVLNVQGTITDNVGMFGEVVIELKHEEVQVQVDHDHSGERTKGEEYYHMDFDIDPASSVDLATLIGDQTIYIPANIDEEELVLIIKVVDDQGNMTIHRTHVHII